MDTKKIIVALDGMNYNNAISLAYGIKDKIWGFKVNDLLLGYGVNVVSELKNLGCKVFADPKLFDIPNTVANGIKRLNQAGADFISVHLSGGRKMLEAAKNEAKECQILGITVLTSMNQEEVSFSYNCENSLDLVKKFAKLALDLDLGGIICSPLEVKPLREDGFYGNLVTPGIRLNKQDTNDQVRTGLDQLADYFVIGRPITQSLDPIKTLEEFSVITN